MDAQDLTEILYEAALDETLWSDAIRLYAEAFGGVGTVILHPGAITPIVSASPGLEAGIEAYNNGWWREDIIVSTAQRLNLFQPGILFDDDFLSAETKARNIHFQEFLRPQDIGSVAIVTARPSGGDSVTINLQRRYGLAPPDAAERRAVTSMSRVVTRALAIRSRLGRAEAARGSLVRTLARFDCAAAIVDAQGCLADTNEAFDALFAEGLTVRDRRVRISTASGQRLFDAVLQAALNGSPEGDVPDTVMLPRASSLFPLLVRISALSGQAAERFHAVPHRHGALILVLDVRHGAYPELTDILTGFGLTRAQAKIALLIGTGHTVRDISEILSIGQATVRTHLKNAFQRLGLSRQADIVRLIGSLAPFGR